MSLYHGGYGVIAAEIFPRDENHRGLVHVENFSYYPENRVGNGLYREGNLLVSEPGHMIFDALLIHGTKSVVYLYKDLSSTFYLGVVNGKGDGNGRFKMVDEEFYEYTNTDIGYQKIFRLLDGKIVPVLEKLRTGTGVTLSETHAIFYHIAQSGNTTIKNESGTEVVIWSYKFRLHLTRRGQQDISTIYKLLLEDPMPSLGLLWKNEHVLEVTKSTGKKLLLNLKDLAPNMF